jgi:hypothetical protein
MAIFSITGIWKLDDIITHYAIHTITEQSTTRGVKTSKADAVKLIETIGNTAYTWLWDYKKEYWILGTQIEVVNGVNGKYLRSYHDDKVVDNLAHLINYAWI